MNKEKIGMLVAYARVSTDKQNLDRQIDALIAAGVNPNMIYQEKITGTKADRPELKRLLDYIREGDTILVSDLTRISRSTKDLFELMTKIEAKGANLKSLKESWIDTSTPMGKFMFTIIAGLAQFERDLIAQRTKEGLEAARARGRLGGRKDKLDHQQKQAVVQLYQSKTMTLKQICDSFGISKPTLYRIVEELSA